MPQNFAPIQETDTLTASRFIMNFNDAAMISNFEGTNFPTLNLQIGMLCYRSDEQRTYQLKSTGPSVWVLTAKLNEVFVTRTDTDARYYRTDGTSSRADLNLRGTGAGASDTAFINFRQDDDTVRVQIGKTSGHDFIVQLFDTNGTLLSTPLQTVSGELRSNNNTIWHSGNDGVGSGLDADRVQNVAPGSFGLQMLNAFDVTAALVLLGLNNSGVGVGDIKSKYGIAADTGWLFMNGLTIGNATSSASARANADTQALFVHLWTVDTSLAVSGGRGASALADFNASKRLTLPDARGRVLVGRDAMSSGSYAGRVNGVVMAFGGTDQLGGYGGSSIVYLTLNEIPYHDHGGATGVAGAHQHGVPYWRGDPQYGAGGGFLLWSGLPYQTGTVTDPAGDHQHGIPGQGGSSWHQNMQPFLIVSHLIKL